MFGIFAGKDRRKEEGEEEDYNNLTHKAEGKNNWLN